MSGYSQITHKGKEINYVDYRGMSLEQMLKTLNEAEKRSLERNSPGGLVLINITGVFAVKEFMQRAKEVGNTTGPLTAKSAIVGITGTKKILLNTYNILSRAYTRAFNNEESAKDWLVK